MKHPNCFWVDINEIICKREERAINIEKPLKSKKAILVIKKGDKYIIIDGTHRYYKKLELGHKKILVRLFHGN